jgi:DNA replication licensing factor MCM3
MIDFVELLPLINEGMPVEELFGSGEARRAADRMQDRNELMIADDVIYKV